MSDAAISAAGFVRSRFFALLMASAVVAIVLGYRAYIGVPMGPSVDGASGRLRSGILANPTDYLSYVAWAQQAKLGHWQFSDLYTTDAHEPLYFNPYFYAVGRISAAAGCDVVWLMNVIALAAAFGATYFMYEAALAAGLSSLGARWCCALSAFSTGLTGLIDLLPRKGYARPFVVGADQVYSDALPISSYLVAPYHAVGLFFVAILAWLIFLNERRKSVLARRGLAVATGLVAAVMVSVRPYEFVLMAGGYALFTLASAIATMPWFASAHAPQQAVRPRVELLLAAAALAGPILLRSYYVSHQPVWENFAAKSLNIPMAPSVWVVGFGIVLWLAAVEIGWAVWSWRSGGVMGWPAAWAGCGVVVLIGLALRQTKLSNGVYFALCLLAGATMERLARWARSRHGPWRLAGYAMIVAIAAIAFSSGALAVIGFVSVKAEEHDAALVEVIQRSGLVGKDQVKILCDPNVGEVLPGLYGFGVYCGHWSLTNDFYTKRYIEFRAGLCPPGDGSPLPTPDQAAPILAELLQAAGCKYVLVSKAMPAYPLLAHWPQLYPVSENHQWALLLIPG